MTDMIARAAKAIRNYVAAIEVGSNATVEAPDPMVHAESYARIVIAAMREPTIPMCNAGDKEHRGVDDPDDTPRVWRAMIDAALQKP